GLVLDAVGTAQGAAVFTAEAVAEQTPFLGQLLVGGGGDLGEEHIRVFPGDDMAGPRGAQRQFIVLALHLAGGQHSARLGGWRAGRIGNRGGWSGMAERWKSRSPTRGRIMSTPMKRPPGVFSSMSLLRTFPIIPAAGAITMRLARACGKMGSLDTR